MGQEDMVDCTLLELTRPEFLAEAGSAVTEDMEEQDAIAKKISVSCVVNAKLIVNAVRRTRKKLLVCFTGDNTIASANDSFVRSQLPGLYNELWDAALECQNVELNCTVLMDTCVSFLGGDGADDIDLVMTCGNKVDTRASTKKMINMIRPRVVVETCEDALQEEMFGVSYFLYDNVKEYLPSFSKIAIGGTFDHFHNGHKKILTIASCLCSTELIIGVTDTPMLKGKKHGELLETLDERKAHVREFLSIVAPSSLQCSLFTIEDVWGPTVSIEDIDALVVSTEVLKGARLINEERQKLGFKPLQVIAIARSNAFTLSSTFVRRLRSSSSVAVPSSAI